MTREPKYIGAALRDVLADPQCTTSQLEDTHALLHETLESEGGDAVLLTTFIHILENKIRNSSTAASNTVSLNATPVPQKSAVSASADRPIVTGGGIAVKKGMLVRKSTMHDQKTDIAPNRATPDRATVEDSAPLNARQAALLTQFILQTKRHVTFSRIMSLTLLSTLVDHNSTSAHLRQNTAVVVGMLSASSYFSGDDPHETLVTLLLRIDSGPLSSQQSEAVHTVIRHAVPQHKSPYIEELEALLQKDSPADEPKSRLSMRSESNDSASRGSFNGASGPVTEPASESRIIRDNAPMQLPDDEDTGVVGESMGKPGNLERSMFGSAVLPGVSSTGNVSDLVTNALSNALTTSATNAFFTWGLYNEDSKPIFVDDALAIDEPVTGRSEDQQPSTPQHLYTPPQASMSSLSGMRAAWPAADRKSMDRKAEPVKVVVGVRAEPDRSPGMGKLATPSNMGPLGVGGRSSGRRGNGLSRSYRDDMRQRTIYLNKLDPLLTEHTLRSFLDTCGQVLRVRLCGDIAGRTKYGFVEYSTKAEADKLAQCDGQRLGETPMRAVPAKQPIQDHDILDAVIDSRRGLTRACLFGLTPRDSFSEKYPASNTSQDPQRERENSCGQLVNTEIVSGFPEVSPGLSLAK